MAIYNHSGQKHAGDQHFTRVRVPQSSLADTGLIQDNNKLKNKFKERALLIQFADNYKRLYTGFPDVEAFQKWGEDLAGSGENVVVAGMTMDNTCVGDIFTVIGEDGTKRPAVLEVSSPRKPCTRWDKKYDTQGLGPKSMRTFVLKNAVGGVFLRVLRGGDINQGDRFILQQRPHPTWSIARVHQLIYGSCTGLEKTLDDEPQWAGTHEELAELRHLEPLAIQEWKDVCEDLLAEAEDREAVTVKEPKRLLPAAL